MKNCILRGLLVGVAILATGIWMFLAWIVGYDIQYNLLDAAETLTATRYYFTCENWQDYHIGSSPPCLAGHTAGWDLIPTGLLFSGIGLIIFGAFATKGRSTEVKKH
jgi:hypothetical protein